MAEQKSALKSFILPHERLRDNYTKYSRLLG